MNEAVRLLEESAARMEVRGWTRGTYGPSEGPNCIAGVISWTGHDLGLSSVVYTARKAVTALPGFPGPGLTHWNDFCCTGPAEASDMLRTAAKRLQEEADVPRA